MPVPMPTIHLTTFIAAPIERVFDLSRNLTIYKQLIHGREEKLSSGASSNLVNAGETITFHAKHFGKTRSVTTKFTTLEKPLSFVQEQVKGDLVRFKHQHFFREIANGTILIDMIDYEGAKDFFGKLLSKIYLKKYLEKYIQKRNSIIQQYAETEKWRAVLT